MQNVAKRLRETLDSFSLVLFLGDFALGHPVRHVGPEFGDEFVVGEEVVDCGLRDLRSEVTLNKGEGKSEKTHRR